MAISAQELSVILSARDRQFTKAMDRAQRRVQGFAAKSQKELGKTTRAFNGLSHAAKRLAPILAAAVGVRAAQNASNVAAEIGRLSQVANASTTEFQKFAIAAKTVGIEQQKAADILKDVNDRVGDFLVTGGGPMADFFEKVAPLVGITADNFRNLSGPDALQLYVSTLQKAGASQQDMTFFMEAMASDATALIPLLQDNAAGLTKLGDEAARSGRIMDEEAIGGALKFQNRMDAIAQKIDVAMLDALTELQVELQFLGDFITEYAVPAFAKLIEGAAGAAGVIDFLAKKFREFKGLDGESDLFGSEDIKKIEDEIARLESARAKDRARIKGFLDAAGGKPENINFVDKIKYDLALDRIRKYNTELDTQHALLASMKKEVETGGKDNVLTIKIDQGTVIDGDPPPDPDNGLNITSDDTKRKMDDLRSSYEGLLHQMMPLVEIEATHVSNLKTINDAVAAGLTDRETANMLIQKSTLEMRRAKDEMSGMADVADALEDGLTSAFMSALDGAKSFEDGIREMARDVIRHLYRVLVVQQMVNAAMGAFGFTPTPSGGFTRTGAGGRQLQSGTPYMTGESGRELFIPSTSGRLLSPVQTNRALSGGDTIEVSQTINVTTGVAQTVRAEVMSMMPQIAEVSKAAVLDAKQRGGAYGRAL